MTTSKTKVLVVDDDAAFTSLLAANLEGTGKYEVRQVNDSRKGLAAGCEFRPDVILLDVSMPDMDGGDLAAQFRKEPCIKDVPIIFLTALVGSEEVPIGGMRSGGNRFLPKPISVAEVIDCLKEVVADRTAAIPDDPRPWIAR